MTSITARDCVHQFIASSSLITKPTPLEITEGILRTTRLSLGTEETPVAPRMDYIKSNLSGYYYVIMCDVCNKRCRKVYPRLLLIDNTKYLKLLCHHCAGVKYKRKTNAERLAGEILKHPDKILDYDVDSMSNKSLFAFMEAQFILDTLREKAENSTYAMLNHGGNPAT